MTDPVMVSTLLKSFQEIISRKDDLLENKENEIERLKKDNKVLINKIDELKKMFLKYYEKNNSIPTITCKIIEELSITSSDNIGSIKTPIEDIESLYKIHCDNPFIAKRIGYHPNNNDIEKMNRSLVVYYNPVNSKYYKLSAYSFRNELDLTCDLIYIRFENDYFGKRIIRGRSISTVRFNSGTIQCKHREDCKRTMCAYNHPELEGKSFIELLKKEELFNLSHDKIRKYKSYYEES